MCKTFVQFSILKNFNDRKSLIESINKKKSFNTFVLVV